MKRNVILTVAIDYSLATLEPFLSSWRRNVGSAELAILACNCDEAFYDAARSMGVIVLDAVSRRPYAAMGARHFMYRDFLRANRRNFDAVLLSDARDVVFQDDPFRPVRTSPVTFASEDRLIGECPLNRWWLTRIYGGKVMEELAGHTISCAGTTIGSLDGILRYLDMMCVEMDGYADRIQENGDQGFHNYILHRLRPDFIVLDEGDEIVATLGYTEPDAIAIDRDRIIVDGVFSPVLHQWDRQEVTRKYLGRRFKLEPDRPSAAG